MVSLPARHSRKNHRTVPRAPEEVSRFLQARLFSASLHAFLHRKRCYRPNRPRSIFPMRTVVQDKYFLRDVHREIDLYDRKMVHIVKHETFATDALRDAAMRKLSLKREGLVATAKSLAASGIEFADHELPRSLRPEGWVDARQPTDTEATASATATAVATMEGTVQPTVDKPSSFGMQVARLQRNAPLDQESPLAAALGSWQDDLAAYKKKRRKVAVAL